MKAFVSLFSFALLTAAAPAALTLSIQEVGADVVINVSGNLDLTGATLTNETSSVFSVYVNPTSSAVTTQSGNADNYATIDVFDVVPDSLGTGGFTGGGSGSGDVFSVTEFSLFLPDGYVSGNALSGSSTFSNATLASLGFTVGDYQWVLKSGDTIDATVAVPEPSVFVLGLATLAGCTAGRRRRPLA